MLHASIRIVTSSSELQPIHMRTTFRADIGSRDCVTEPGQSPNRGAARNFSILARSLYTAVALATLSWVAPCQEMPRIEPTQPDPRTDSERSDTQQGRRTFSLIPNYRTFPSLENHFVSIISFLPGPDSDRSGAGFRRKEGRGFDGKWGTVPTPAGHPMNECPLAKQIRASLAQTCARAELLFARSRRRRFWSRTCCWWRFRSTAAGCCSRYRRQ